VSRTNHSADALSEILQMCEEALAALTAEPDTSLPAPMERKVKLRQRRAPTARPFVMIRGGLLRLSQKISRR